MPPEALVPSAPPVPVLDVVVEAALPEVLELVELLEAVGSLSHPQTATDPTRPNSQTLRTAPWMHHNRRHSRIIRMVGGKKEREVGA